MDPDTGLGAVTGPRTVAIAEQCNDIPSGNGLEVVVTPGRTLVPRSGTSGWTPAGAKGLVTVTTVVNVYRNLLLQLAIGEYIDSPRVGSLV